MKRFDYFRGPVVTLGYACHAQPALLRTLETCAGRGLLRYIRHVHDSLAAGDIEMVAVNQLHPR